MIAVSREFDLHNVIKPIFSSHGMLHYTFHVYQPYTIYGDEEREADGLDYMDFKMFISNLYTYNNRIHNSVGTTCSSLSLWGLNNCEIR